MEVGEEKYEIRPCDIPIFNSHMRSVRKMSAHMTEAALRREDDQRTQPGDHRGRQGSSPMYPSKKYSMTTETEGVGRKRFHRRKIDREEELGPLPQMDINSSSFVSRNLAFNIKRKLRKLDLVTFTLCSTHSIYQLNALEQLASLIVQDTRLVNYIDCAIRPRLFDDLIKCLELQNEKDSPIVVNDEKKVHPGNKKNFRVQYLSLVILRNMVPSKNGLDFKGKAIPYLVKLIQSPDMYVQIEALRTLSEIATVFPESCMEIINYEALKLLDTLLRNKRNHFILLNNGSKLLTTLCRMKSYIPTNKIDLVRKTLRATILYDHEEVLIQTCLALSILSNEQDVTFEDEVYEHLLDLINYAMPEIVFAALGAIGNYVRWKNHEQIEVLIKHGILLQLGSLLNHKYTKVRKEACGIVSNIIAAANTSQMQKVIDACLIDRLVGLVENAELDVKEVAAFAISNAIAGCNNKQFRHVKEKCIEPLNVVRCFSNDPHAVGLCIGIQDNILSRASEKCTIVNVEIRILKSMTKGVIKGVNVEIRILKSMTKGVIKGVRKGISKLYKLKKE